MARAVLKEKGGYERSLRIWDELHKAFVDATTMIELGEEVDDFETIDEGGEMLVALEPQVREAEIQRMLCEPNDECDAVVEINKGAGGTDAADWADMLRRMYIRWADRMGFKVEVVDENLNEDAGINSATLEIRGAYAYGYLKAEIGVHRLVRISPFDANARRQTAFSSVYTYPDVEDEIEIDINEADLKVDTMRSGGAGGQHVNTTDSAVRITHIPTNTIVKCQMERSQHKNRAKAMKMLKAKLYQLEIQKRQEVLDQQNSKKKAIEWGSQIRSYTLQPFKLVKDVRTGYETSNADGVLDGALQPFMEAWLVQRTAPGADADDNG